MRLAIFDIDGTLISGSGSERRFYKYLLQNGCQGPRQITGFLRELVGGLPRHGRHAFKKNKGYLAGLDVQRITRLAQNWADATLDAILYPPAIACLRQHQAVGDRIVLLSGTPDFLAAAIARELDVPASIGSGIATHAGRFRRCSPTPHPFGPVKRRLAAGLAADLGLAANDCIAYADSIYDRSLLEWAGTAVAVRPDRKLATVARAHGWTMIDDDGPAAVCQVLQRGPGAHPWE